MPITWVRVLFWSYLFFLVWAYGTISNPADPDLWHRLYLGEALWKTGHFPLGDDSSYLADYQNISDHEWGSAVIFYALYQGFGPSAIVILKLIGLAITVIFLVLAGLRQRPLSPLMAAFYSLVLLALLPSFGSTARCMIFTHIFFALWLFWFQCERYGRPIPAFWYVLTIIIWANLHGGFAIGLAWLLGLGLIEMWYGFNGRKWLIRFGLCLMATLINPFGWHLWITTVRALLVTRQGFYEWGPVPWLVIDYPGYKLLLLGTLVAIAVQSFHRKSLVKTDLMVTDILIAFIVLSITSARHASIFASVAGALLPGFFPSEPRLQSIVRPLHRQIYVALSALLFLSPLYAVFFLPSEKLTLTYPSVAAPVQAVDYLKQQKIRGNLLVPFNYGSYAMWQLRGQMRVSMDGRYDLVYHPETYRRVADFFLAKDDWKNLLTTPPPEAILVRVADPVYPKLKDELGWMEAYRNTTDAVFLPR